MSKKRAPHKPQSLHAKKYAGRLYLVVIDQEPLRKNAASECSRAISQLEKARAEWRRFDAEDRPAFERWMAATFGGMQTKIREVQEKVRERLTLIEQVEMEMMFGGRGGYGGAYKRVMEERAAGEERPGDFEGERPPGDEGGWGGADEDAAEDGPDSFEEELLFQHFARMVLGINPDRLNDAEYERLLKEFREHVLRKNGPQQQQPPPPPPPPPRGSKSSASPSSPAKSAEARVKELYRLLVRRLHPDLRADKDAEVSHFWHDVQEAYAQGNVERLEMLLALTDLQSDAVGDHTSLFQMRSVLKELRKAFQALQRSLSTAKKDPAWKFASMTNRQQVRAGIQRRLERELRDQEHYLKDLEAQIARWEAAANRGKKSPKKKPTQKSMPPPKMSRPQGTRAQYTETEFPF